MPDKSHVGMGAEHCPICLEAHNETVLLASRVNPRTRELDTPFEHGQHYHTGWSLCPEHAEMEKEYVALVAVNREPSPNDGPGEWDRTGENVHIRRDAWSKLFTLPPPEGPIGVISADAFEKIKEILHGDT